LTSQELAFSKIQIIVERNLGFEAEHIERALKMEENVFFYRDAQAGRTGVLTTENVKLGAMTMTNVMLREKRIHILAERLLVSQVRLLYPILVILLLTQKATGRCGCQAQAQRSARDLFLSVQNAR